MFKSRRRPIVIPQSEHLKLAGTLAWLWGNAQFDRPPVEHLSFITGVALHDRGYGYLDNAPIDEMPESEWMQITRRGFYQAVSDPIADLIIKLHLRRLASYGSSPERRALLAELEQGIQDHLQQHPLARETFERIDRITNFCDSIAYDFCFEQPDKGAIKVFPRNDKDDIVALHYFIEAEAIKVGPWPFSVESYSNYLIGYQSQYYPATLDPVILPFHVSKTENLPDSGESG